MQPRRFEIVIPGTIAGYLQMDDEKIKMRVNKLLLADLARQGIISFGKAAEIAGTDKMTFIAEMSHMGIPYFDGTVSEVISDAETVGNTMRGASH